MTPPTSRATPTSALALLAVAALFAATHPFVGFVGDSQIYLGRALADVDPAGVGRDLMFRLDNQSRFSVFPPIAAWLLRRLSLLSTAMILVAAASVAWFAALVALARQAAPARPYVAVALVTLAPAVYGGFDLLHFSESLAEPRPFAEAFVLASLAAFLGGHRIVSAALLAVAALFHPIMALAGVATVGLALCFENRRWILAPVFGAVALGLAVALGAPVAARLAVAIDPQWLDELTTRNAYLFPHLWPLSAFILPLVQALTIVLAATRANAPVRRLLLAGLIAGVAGLAVAWICGRFDPLLLVMQAQTWRMFWLTGVLAALALALCAQKLGQGDAADRLALACLALAWTLPRELGAPLVVLALAALVLATRPTHRRLQISDGFLRLTWIGVALAVVAPALMDLADIHYFAGLFQPDFRPGVAALALKFVGAPLLLAVILLAAFGSPPVLAHMSRSIGAAAAVLAACGAAAIWNDASSYDRALGVAPRQADLESIAPHASGETLWLFSSLEPWIFLGRPSWSADLQGAGGVFSRELAMLYAERANFQIELGLRDETLMRRAPRRPRTVHPALTLDNIGAVCRRPDAPTTIVAPVARGVALDPALRAKTWTPPAVRVEPLLTAERIEYPRIDAYAVIACADHR